MVKLKKAGADKLELRAVYEKYESLNEKNKKSYSSCGCVNELLKLLAYIKDLYIAVGHTYSKPRSDHRRLYLWLCSIVFFFYLKTELGLLHGPILGKYYFSLVRKLKRNQTVSQSNVSDV